eukprot:CAMPEP_0114665778 /NCGR_PEP_ID=MMETSP0191-20121206/31401_1 /TAXON_ID=126664 /ORGANISM="Sorites sp." /LENGTH=50 /DNA_ID=CAMNT_0001911767 /DNA_START=662 /DNA_END=814 /DNA_ORIENTATION=+
MVMYVLEIEDIVGDIVDHHMIYIHNMEVILEWDGQDMIHIGKNSAVDIEH